MVEALCGPSHVTSISKLVSPVTSELNALVLFHNLQLASVANKPLSFLSLNSHKAFPSNGFLIYILHSSQGIRPQK